MGYNNETEISGKKAEIANHCVQATAKIMKVSLGAMNEPGEKVSLLAGCSIPSLTGLAIVFSKQESMPDRKEPTAEEVTFGACYVMASVEDHERGVFMGFSPETVDKALTIFKTVMGRDYTNIATSLQTMIERQKTRADRGTPDYLKKFLPH